MPYITPDEIPDTYICRCLKIPADVTFLAAVSGALRELTFPHNWEQVGGVTAEEAAAAGQTLLDDYFVSADCCGGGMEYHGVMAGRDTPLTIPTVGINVPYTDDAGGRLHDTDGYWSPTKRTQFIVPTGLGGWYRMSLYMLWAGGTGQPRVDVRNQVGAPIYAQEAINLSGLYTSWLSAVALLEDNAGVIVQAFSAIADRDIIVGGFEFSTSFHMYRIGDSASP